MDYETITDADKLALARDRLRGLESDHYRLSITPSAPDASESRLAEYEVLIGEVKSEITRLNPPADPAPPAEEPNV